MKVRLLYLANDDGHEEYLAVDTSGFASKEKLSKKYGIKVQDVLILPISVTKRLDAWPTDRLMTDQ